MGVMITYQRPEINLCRLAVVRCRACYGGYIDKAANLLALADVILMAIGICECDHPQ